MTNSLFKAIEQLSTREGYYSSLIKAKIFKDIEKNSDNMPLSQLVIEHKNGIWGKEYLEGGVEVKVLRSPDIRHGFIDSKNAEKRFITDEDYNKHKLVFGDILVIKSNGSQDLVGKSQLFDIDEEGIIASNFVLRLRPNLEMINAYYLDLFLKSPQSLMWRFDNQTTTTGLRNLKTKEYLATLIPLPSIEVQKYIVKFYKQCINGKFEKNPFFLCDEYEKIYNIVNEHELLNRNIKRQNEVIQYLKRSIIQDAIQGKLVQQDKNDEPASVLAERIKAEKEKLIKEKKLKKEKPLPKVVDEEKPFKLPEGWEWVRFGEITYNIQSGKSPKCENRPATYPEWGVLKVSAVSWGKFNPKENKYLPMEDLQNEEYEVHEGDFLMTRANTAELVARSVIVEETPKRLLMSDKVLRVTFSKDIDPYYMNIINLSSFARGYYAKVATGTSDSMKNVSREQIKNLLVPLPPLNEQNRIVDKVNQLMTLCDELEQSIEQSKREAENLMQAFLQEAFTVKEEVLN